MKTALAASALLTIGAAAPPSAPIEVTISGMRSAIGRVVVTVCPEESFLKACPWGAQAPASTSPVALVVRGVPPGRYAVQAFHDANSNGTLDTGWFGIPKEGIGFSNDAMPRLMKPQFRTAAIVHGTVPQRVAVLIRYLSPI